MLYPPAQPRPFPCALPTLRVEPPRSLPASAFSARTPLARALLIAALRFGPAGGNYGAGTAELQRRNYVQRKEARWRPTLDCLKQAAQPASLGGPPGWVGRKHRAVVRRFVPVYSEPNLTQPARG